MKTIAKIEQGKFKETNALLTFLEVNDNQEIELRTIKGTRTDQQNKALHTLFTLWANALNEAGYTVQLVLKEKIDLDWNGEKVKELLWRPAQQAILGKKSTIELSKQKDIDMVYKHLVRHLGEKFELEIPRFPSKCNSCSAFPCICVKHNVTGAFSLFPHRENFSALTQL